MARGAIVRQSGELDASGRTWNPSSRESKSAYASVPLRLDRPTWAYSIRLRTGNSTSGVVILNPDYGFLVASRRRTFLSL